MAAESEAVAESDGLLLADSEGFVAPASGVLFAEDLSESFDAPVVVEAGVCAVPDDVEVDDGGDEGEVDGVVVDEDGEAVLAAGFASSLSASPPARRCSTG